MDSDTVKKLLYKIFPVCQCSKQKQRSSSTFPTPSSLLSSPRICTRHDVTIPIEETTQSLDVFKKCISTLLCYLEQQKCLEVVNLSYDDTCILTWEGGKKQFRALKRKVPVVAKAAELIENGESMGLPSWMLLTYCFVYPFWRVHTEHVE